jgi:hypothetical protein
MLQLHKCRLTVRSVYGSLKPHADQDPQIVTRRGSSSGQLVSRACGSIKDILTSARIKLTAGPILLSATKCWWSGHYIQIKPNYGPMFRMPGVHQHFGSFNKYGIYAAQENCNR